MCAQTFLVTSLLGSGSDPTIFANSADGRMGFINALFAFDAAFLATLASIRNAIVIVMDSGGLGFASLCITSERDARHCGLSLAV